jgi:hypothetical protein
VNEYESDGTPSVFLGGGIMGCPDWHHDVVSLLAGEPVVLLNPRRKDFPINDPKAAPQQIEWEYRQLRKADGILFWFPSETLCPIGLYELGAWSMTSKPLFVGVHPSYRRRQDVELQTKLARPDVSVVYGLPKLAAGVKKWLAGFNTDTVQR